MNTPVLRHCHLQRDADGLAWLALDHAGARVNVLSEALLDDIGLALDALRAEPPTGLVIRSAKAAGFMAGADLKLLATLSEIDAARAFAERVWPPRPTRPWPSSTATAWAEALNWRWPAVTVWWPMRLTRR